VVSSSIFFLSYFPRLILAVADWMSATLLHMVGLRASLRCRSETCCTRLAKNTNAKSRQNRHLGTIAQLCRAISTQLRHIWTIGKNMLSSNIFSACPHNTVNFGPQTSEIGPVVWGTRANFNGFRVLAARYSGNGRQPINFASLNRGRHLHSAGQPSL